MLKKRYGYQVFLLTFLKVSALFLLALLILLGVFVYHPFEMKTSLMTVIFVLFFFYCLIVEMFC